MATPDRRSMLGLDAFAEQTGLTRGRVQWLFERAKVIPYVSPGASPGRGYQKLWPADYVYLVKALDRLARLQCPKLWLGAVGAWWEAATPDVVATARYLVVSPSRERAPVFVTNRRNLGEILAGCHAWIIDLLDQQTYR